MSATARDAEQPLQTSSQSDNAELRLAICRAAASVLSGEYGDALDAVVLTGSMARDEATLVRGGDTSRVLGDAEFLVSFKRNCQPTTSEELLRVSQKIESLLQNQQIECSIDLGPVPPNYFSKLPPDIFSFELKAGGKQVFGHTDVLSQIPHFSAAEISREDAWRLLCNRLLELLECGEEILVSDEEQTERLRYKLVKLYLDMATSLLIFKEHYAPTYSERCANILTLAERGTGANGPDFDLANFAKLVSLCTRMKLRPAEAGSDAPVLGARDAIRTAHSIWRWELQTLTESSTSISDNDLMREISSRQSVTQRLRGWAFAARAIGLVRTLGALPRWLWIATKNSPRNLIYLAGTTLLFNVAKPAGSECNTNQFDLRSLTQLLPVTSFAEPKSSIPDWKDLAQGVFQNYQRFVLKTRA
jgi:hypothetical protein